jgi:hypothetical protein
MYINIRSIKVEINAFNIFCLKKGMDIIMKNKFTKALGSVICCLTLGLFLNVTVHVNNSNVSKTPHIHIDELAPWGE